MPIAGSIGAGGRLTIVAPRGTLTLTKHEAAGNDFLVLVDPDGRRHVSADEARLLCDRHRGIGADGIVHVARGAAGTDVAMVLRNADGTTAEMSGNGIRCVVQAAIDAGLADAGVVTVATDGGVRHVDYRPGEEPGTGLARVDMGEACLGAELPLDATPRRRRGRTVDMGNPHVVLFGAPPHDDELRVEGRRLDASAPAGTNVEFVWRGLDDELYLQVWERGVGETLACGTGTCAAAAVLHDWGLVGTTVRVHNPGGTLEVELTPTGVVLAGPTRLVGTVSVDEDTLASMVRGASAHPQRGHFDEVAITQ